MKPFLRKYFLFVYFFIVISSDIAYTKDISDSHYGENFEMEISLEKSEYLDGEFVILLIKVKNTGSYPDSVEFLNGEFLSKSIRIKNKSNNSSGFIGADAFYVSTPYTVIPPNGEIVFPVKLNNLWGFQSYEVYDDSNKGFADRYFPQDSYSIEVIFKYDEGRKNIISNKINFEVKAPIGSEAQAFKELKELYKLPFGGFYSEIQNQEGILKWVDFLDTHTNSVYFENAFSESVPRRKFRNYMYDSTMLNHCNLIINKIPNSLTARTAINTSYEVINKMSGKNEALLYLEKVKDDYADTGASSWAEYLLGSKEFNK